MTYCKEIELARISQQLGESAIGHTVDYHATLDSTMPRAHSLAGKPSCRSGTLVVTEEQSAGMGRRGRQWSAPYGKALLFSVVLRQPLLPSNPTHAPMAAGLAVMDAIRVVSSDLARAVSLKWPNDVLVNTPTGPGKVAGILSEGSFIGHRLDYAIVGIGINVNQTIEELPEVEPRMMQPVSLLTILGHTIDRTELLIAVCRQLTTYLQLDHPADTVQSIWQSNLSTLHKTVDVYASLESDAAVVRGTALSVTESGELVVRDEAGVTHTFPAGDVSVRESLS